jgi:hypothetical protein
MVGVGRIPVSIIGIISRAVAVGGMAVSVGLLVGGTLDGDGSIATSVLWGGCTGTGLDKIL